MTTHEPWVLSYRIELSRLPGGWNFCTPDLWYVKMFEDRSINKISSFITVSEFAPK